MTALITLENEEWSQDQEAIALTMDAAIAKALGRKRSIPAGIEVRVSYARHEYVNSIKISGYEDLLENSPDGYNAVMMSLQQGLDAARKVHSTPLPWG